MGLGAAATRTTNPLLLGLIVAVATLVVSARRPQAQWAGAFGVFVRIALVVIVIRVVFAMLFGVRIGATELFALPTVGLPEWMAGVTLGGPVTAEMLYIAVIQGAQLATLLICVGAANSLASPVRLLKSAARGALPRRGGVCRRVVAGTPHHGERAPGNACAAYARSAHPRTQGCGPGGGSRSRVLAGRRSIWPLPWTRAATAGQPPQQRVNGRCRPPSCWRVWLGSRWVCTPCSAPAGGVGCCSAWAS